MPPRILILGSCVSRDILNFAKQGSFTVADYFARSSVASLAAEPSQIDEECYARITSDFQRRMVRRDVNKDFLSGALDGTDFDVILIDLIDERFDLFEVRPGALVTVSGELLLTGFVGRADRLSERWIRSGSERHRALWKAGMEGLFSALHERGLAHKVIVNKVFWANALEDGEPLPGCDAAVTQAANEMLAWMYFELEQYVPTEQWMRFPETVLRANPTHRWGIAPFHYSDAYYEDALQQVDASISRADTSVDFALEDTFLTARVRATADLVSKFLFLVFKDEVLVHTQPYSDNAALQFDTRGVRGDYVVVALVLSFSPANDAPRPIRASRRKRFSI